MLTNPPYFKEWWNINIQHGLLGPILISPLILPDFRSPLISLWREHMHSLMTNETSLMQQNASITQEIMSYSTGKVESSTTVST